MNLALSFLVLLGAFTCSECATSFDLYVYIGQSVELRCVANESTAFTRIQHILPNGTIETLLSNDKLNSGLSRKSELHIEKVGHIYIVKIEPVRLHSAGVYTCEDDISLNNNKNHVANLTVHVIGVHMHNPAKILSKGSNNLNIYTNNYKRIKNNSFKFNIKLFSLILNFLIGKSLQDIF